MHKEINIYIDLYLCKHTYIYIHVYIQLFAYKLICILVPFYFVFNKRFVQKFLGSTEAAPPLLQRMFHSNKEFF